MRAFVTAVVALLASCAAAATIAVLLAEWAGSGEAYILVFMAIFPAAMVTLLVLGVATLIPAEGRRAVTNAAAVVACVLGLVLAGLCAIAFFASANVALAWREIKFNVAIIGVCLVVVAVQWAVFRWRLGRPAKPPAPV